MGVHDYIPYFDLADRFCYFLDLNQSAIYNKGSLKRAKIELYNSAMANIVNPLQQQISLNNNKQRQTETIKNAIQFLKKVAESERNKEIRVINKYIEDLKNNEMIQHIMKSEKKNELDNLIKDLQNFSHNPNSKDVKNFYIKLTLLLNTVRTTIEHFKTRVEQLNDENRRTTEQIRADFFALRLPSDLDSLFKSMSGVIQREKKDSLSKQARTLLVNYAIKNLDNNPAFLDYPYEVMAELMIDFYSFLQSRLDIEYRAGKKKLEDLEIEELFQEWEKSERDIFQRLKSNANNLLKLHETIQSQTGLQIVGKETQEYKRNIERLEKNRRTKTGRARSETNKKLSAILAPNKLGPQIAWKMEILDKNNRVSRKKNLHGVIYEAIEPVLSRRAQKIKGTAAADILTLDVGKIELDASLESQLDQKVNSIITLLEDYAKTTRVDRLEDFGAVTDFMNGNLRKYTESINDILKQKGIQEDVFIYHESLKLYTQIETHEKKYFRGRELGILNALDNIYSMNGIEDLQLPNKDIMYNIALNLSKYAIGGKLKGDIENYLSIFAGLLMFDDLQNMAYDIANNTINQLNTQIGEVKHVHLYLLNDIYIPSSFLLTTLALTLEQGYLKITASIGARVKIDTSEIDSAISEYLFDRFSGIQGYSLEEDTNKKEINQVNKLWNLYGDFAMRDTKIQIIFLASYFDFLKDIQFYMEK